MKKPSMDSISIYLDVDINVANMKVEHCNKDIDLGLTKREAKPTVGICELCLLARSCPYLITIKAFN